MSKVLKLHFPSSLRPKIFIVEFQPTQTIKTPPKKAKFAESLTEAYLERWQTSKIEDFEETVDGLHLECLKGF